MKILVVTYSPLNAELGAAQSALNLAAALRARGHDALAWSPETPPGVGRWDLRRRQREAMADFLARHGPFDVIDMPAIGVSRALARQARLVVRSIQPELLYLEQEIRSDLGRRFPPTLRTLAHAVIAAPRAVTILAGWRRARFILCLGTIELSWMLRRFPRWAPKLGSYVCALSPAERPVLAEVRRRRPAGPEGEGLRFLWVGRWAAHKGTRRLVRWIADRSAIAPHDTFTLAGCGAAAERDLRPEWLRSGRVRLVPAFARAELPALLASHDAGVFTSTVEGWGLSLNEMLESGLPVFATEAGGVADLKPYFPQSLRPFPPPVQIELPPEREDLEANGYFARFDWAVVARDYEEAALTPRRHGR
jgi:glycosyltransferase involved in cell wall biosynthesis